MGDLVSEAIALSVEQIFELIHVEGKSFFRVGERVGTAELQIFIAIKGTVLGINNPDFGDPHRSVVFQLEFETLHPVFRRQYLEDS